jgi:hypothetical protein
MYAHAHAHAIFISTTTKPLPDSATNTDYDTLTLTAGGHFSVCAAQVLCVYTYNVCMYLCTKLDSRAYLCALPKYCMYACIFVCMRGRPFHGVHITISVFKFER